MTTTALLIRHGHVEAIGRRLVGRLPGVTLSNSGLSEVERLRAIWRRRSTRSIRARLETRPSDSCTIGR